MTLAPTNAAHVEELALNMREADAAECAAGGRTPGEAVLQSWQASDFATTMLLDGRVVAIGGLALERSSAIVPRAARGWLLTTGLVERAPLDFHRAVKLGLRAAHQHAPLLWGQVDARYFVCLRWLLALGFSIYAPRPAGPLGRLFHLVVREA